MATQITKTERDTLQNSIHAHTIVGTHRVIVAYDRWLEDTGRVYDYDGDLEADIENTFGPAREISVYGDTEVARDSDVDDCTKKATPKSLAR